MEVTTYAAHDAPDGHDRAFEQLCRSADTFAPVPLTDRMREQIAVVHRAAGFARTVLGQLPASAGRARAFVALQELVMWAEFGITHPASGGGGDGGGA